MYHHILPPARVGREERYPDLYVDPAVFDAQMAALHASGWRTWTARQLAVAMNAGTGVPQRTVVITLDDGRPDNYTFAFPILQRYGFVATFYVVPGRIGTTREMTACQLEEIAAAGDEIGDHTMDHRDLRSLSFDRARWEIRAAADTIESLVGVRPDTLAYPAGGYDAAVIRAADAEGIDLAFTTHRGAFETAAIRLEEPRLRINGLVRQLDGSYAGGTTARQLLALLATYAAS
jgi:peptidoglycan/xylan/chitin deacetylase (PgdA/CDA1 family)